MCKPRIKLKVREKNTVVTLASKQRAVNITLVAELAHQLELAKEGKINCLAIMSYCANQEERWFSYIGTAGVLTTTDCFVFTESLSRQVDTMRNIADDIREKEMCQ